METNISDGEWEIMRVVWNKKATTSQEIISLLEEGMDWKPSTIKTLLGRLVEKGLLSTEKEGVRFIYRPLVTQQESLREKVSKLFSQVCNESHANLLELLIGEASLTKDSVNQLLNVLTHKETETVISCNCLPGQCDCQHNHYQKASN